MVDIQRIVVQWSGLNGLPGESVFYGLAGSTANADIKAYFTAIQSVFPAGLSWVIPGSGDLLDVASGHLTGSWTNAGGGGTVAASGAAAYATGCGTWVTWQTSLIPAKRRLKGKTILAPLMNSAYTNGAIVSGNVTTLQNAANTLVTGAKTMIWHRPVGFAGGVATNPTAAQQSSVVTSLKTRRH